jgi:hypothetical protein
MDALAKKFETNKHRVTTGAAAVPILLLFLSYWFLS